MSPRTQPFAATLPPHPRPWSVLDDGEGGAQYAWIFKYKYEQIIKALKNMNRKKLKRKDKVKVLVDGLDHFIGISDIVNGYWKNINNKKELADFQDIILLTK